MLLHRGLVVNPRGRPFVIKRWRALKEDRDDPTWQARNRSDGRNAALHHRRLRPGMGGTGRAPWWRRQLRLARPPGRRPRRRPEGPDPPDLHQPSAPAPVAAPAVDDGAGSAEGQAPQPDASDGGGHGARQPAPGSARPGAVRDGARNPQRPDARSAREGRADPPADEAAPPADAGPDQADVVSLTASRR